LSASTASSKPVGHVPTRFKRWGRWLRRKAVEEERVKEEG
jgi:hypothetical protein